MGKKRFATYAAKMRQANREAVATVVALAVIVATWLVAVLAAIVLARGVFANFSLDDDDEEGAAHE